LERLRSTARRRRCGWKRNQLYFPLTRERSLWKAADSCSGSRKVNVATTVSSTINPANAAQAISLVATTP
jgi:hypothetical protein